MRGNLIGIKTGVKRNSSCNHSHTVDPGPANYLLHLMAAYCQNGMVMLILVPTPLTMPAMMLLLLQV